MRAIILMSVLLALTACSDDQAPKEREKEKNFGAGLGETYRGMMDEARQTTDQLNAQMQRTEEEVREHNE